MRQPYQAIVDRLNGTADDLEALAKRIRAIAPQLVEADDFGLRTEPYIEQIDETVTEYEQLVLDSRKEY